MSLAAIRQTMQAKCTPLGKRPAHRPSLAVVFLVLVLPLSLLPPAMFVFAAASHPLLHTAASAPWHEIAVSFFVAELTAFAAMGGLIREIGARYKIDVSLHDAYMMAAVCPVPMWLSSLAIPVDNLAISAVIGLAGLWLSELLVYRRAMALGRDQDEIRATGFAASAISAALIAWAMLLMLIAVLV